jgi:hypothetical protein
MGDTRPGPGIIDPDEEPEVTTVERIREVIAGDKRAVVRRIILYVIAGALIVSPLPVVAIIPLILLATTDQLA